jgi:sugar phosphate isomerase/epimerase
MIALSTGSLYTYGTARAFDLAARAGFDGVEVLVDHRWDTRQPDYLRRLSADFALPIVAVHNPFVTGVEGWPATAIGAPSPSSPTPAPWMRRMNRRAWRPSVGPALSVARTTNNRNRR